MQAVNFENMSKAELIVALSASIAAEHEYSVLLDQSSDPIFAFYPDGTYRYVNRAFAQGVGKPINQIVGNKIWDVFSKDEADKRFSVVKSVFDSGDTREIEVRVPTPGGDHYYLTTVKPILDAKCHVISVICISKDITERKRIDETIKQLAYHDSLTHLPNRRLLNDRLRQAMAFSSRSKNYGALMFLDLDNFKPLNDAYGHEAGDLLLIEVADRLKRCVREMDTVARFGGDEFVVMMSELDMDKENTTSKAEAIAEEIRMALSRPYRIAIKGETEVDTATIEHRCTASIGVTLFVGNESSYEDLLKWADDAMYQAKAAGRNLIRFHCSNDSSSTTAIERHDRAGL